MTDDWTRTLIVVMVFVAFVGLMLVVLLGLVEVSNPELAKLVGAIFGYLSGLLSPIVARYFTQRSEP